MPRADHYCVCESTNVALYLLSKKKKKKRIIQSTVSSIVYPEDRMTTGFHNWTEGLEEVNGARA